MDLHLI
jgi:excisionase family DNA binding protein